MTAIPRQSLATTVDHAESHEHEPLSFLRKYLFATDHKIIGIQFMFLALIFFVVGGLLAMLIRWQLAWPDRPVPIIGAYFQHQGIWPGSTMPPDFFTGIVTMHGTIMIFFVIIPLVVGVFGNYLIPLKIGAADMAFPFLNGFAFWLSVPAGALMVLSFFLPGGSAAAGWTSYDPLSQIREHDGAWVAAAAPDTIHGVDRFAEFLRVQDAGKNRQGDWSNIALFIGFGSFFAMFAYLCAYYVRAGSAPANWLLSILLASLGALLFVHGVQFIVWDGQSAWFMSLIVLGFSSILGAVNYLTTILKLRCPGMTMFRLPLSIWSLFFTSLLIVLATPVLAAALTMNLLDHNGLTSFFLPFNWTLSDQLQTNSGGGYSLLHEHLFWFYSHPAVYIMILPAMGMVSDILAAGARKPVFGYRPMVYALAAIVFLGFIVWAHHMFQSGLNPTLGTTFAISTMFIAVPSAIKVFNWLGTLWGGNIRFTTATLNAIAFVAMFIIGGLSGIFMASTAVDVHIHATYFIVAHIHYVLFGASTFGIFAAIYFWYPKMFGRMMNETLGKIHFVLSFIAFNLTFFPMHILGLGGMPRRIADFRNYESFRHFDSMNKFITISAFVLGASQIFFIINFVGSWIWGPKAPKNPWEATTLEWETTSPPPHGNFEKVPVVHHGPYEYSSPLVEEDWLPQTRWVDTAGRERVRH
jgi:cytochrome c oxidase subunit 1